MLPSNCGTCEALLPILQYASDFLGEVPALFEKALQLIEAPGSLLGDAQLLLGVGEMLY